MQQTAHLPAVEVTTAEPAGAAVIWLHGLGANGHDFEPLVPELGLNDHAIRFVFPHAPRQPVSLNGGMVIPSWYDIHGLDSSAREDEQSIRAMAPAIEKLIQREGERGISSERIVLAGFSQGGALALHVGLRYPQKLAGIMGLSAYLPLHTRVAAERSSANADTPIFMAHGQHDPVLDYSLGATSRDILKRLNYPVEWHEYPMPHAVCPEEIDHVRAWFIDRLA
ncbi:MAG: alpha/beta hydrolase [Pseudomonadota bacterium]|nr:alpha/beta hydrolase [Pseudomonadota bacterium]